MDEHDAHIRLKEAWTQDAVSRMTRSLLLTVIYSALAVWMLGLAVPVVGLVHLARVKGSSSAR